MDEINKAGERPQARQNPGRGFKTLAPLLLAAEVQSLDIFQLDRDRSHKPCVTAIVRNITGQLRLLMD